MNVTHDYVIALAQQMQLLVLSESIRQRAIASRAIVMTMQVLIDSLPGFEVFWRLFTHGR